MKHNGHPLVINMDVLAVAEGLIQAEFWALLLLQWGLILPQLFLGLPKEQGGLGNWIPCYARSLICQLCWMLLFGCSILREPHRCFIGWARCFSLKDFVEGVFTYLGILIIVLLLLGLGQFWQPFRDVYCLCRKDNRFLFVLLGFDAMKLFLLERKARNKNEFCLKLVVTLEDEIRKVILHLCA